jgi:GNAT superfamily N-acetyltransferase
MDSIVFRQGTVKDFPAFYSFFKKSIPEQFTVDYSPITLKYIIEVSDSRSILNRGIKDGSYILFLAFKDKTVIGFVLARKVFAGVSMAQWVAVDAKFQKKGIASKLLDLWSESALQSGAHALQLWTGDRNANFYKHRGFVYAGRFPHAWFGFDVNLFYKHLQEPQEQNFLNGYLQKKEK